MKVVLYQLNTNRNRWEISFDSTHRPASNVGFTHKTILLNDFGRLGGHFISALPDVDKTIINYRGVCFSIWFRCELLPVTNARE